MKTKYMNPYLAGVLLGLVLLSAFYFSGRGLGASGAVKSVVVQAVDTVSPSHVASSEFYSKYAGEGKKPLNSWLVFEVLGVLVGGFLSGALAGRLKFKIEHSPKITSKTADSCRNGWNTVWIWKSTWPWVHQRVGSNRHGCFIIGRFCNNDGHFWNSVCLGIFFQKKLDLGEYNGTISTSRNYW